MPMPTVDCFSLIVGISGTLNGRRNALMLQMSAKIFEEKSMTDDIEVKREIILEADAETIERMRKEGHARGFTVYCDEAERIGGDNSAPPPLAYFGLAVGF
jgi:hypothetical protein